MTLRWRSDGPHGAPTLVLLNSVGATTEMWTPVLAPLAEQFRVVRIDTRGHGDSPAAGGTSTTLADLGADVLATLDEIGLQRVHVAGLSLGGMVGMWLAAHRPARVQRLALLCTSAQLPPDAFVERAATVRREGMDAIADAAVARWLTPGVLSRDPELARSVRTMFTSVDAESYAQCCEAIAGMDLRPDLARIAAPTLVIAGGQDRPTPPEHAHRIAEGIAGARVEVLEAAAHLATAEQPGRIAELLLAHFRAGATLAAGYGTRREVLGDSHVEAAIAATTELTAPFQEFITRYAWGDVWNRPGLDRRERSIATLAALVTLGADEEVRMHIRAAIGNGLTAAEIGEVLLHTGVYAGLPRANRALAVAREILDRE